ncbi:ATP-binding protein [Colwelliaceae bacterium BS250]
MLSIRRYQLLIIISLLTLISFSAAISGYSASMQQAQQVFDDDLQAFAKTLINIQFDDQVIQLDDEVDLALQIWQQQTLILHTNNTPTKNIMSFIAGFDDVNFSGKRWRSYAYFDSNKWIFVAQPIAKRFDIAEKMTLAAVTPLIFSIPFIAIFISFAVKRSLNPLNQLAKILHAKQAKDFTPITLKQNSKELVPITNTLNQLLCRLDDAFLREKRFASDVAHELRTPISVIKLNSHNLKSELLKLPEHNLDLEQTKQLMLNINVNLDDLEVGIVRMASVVEQILLLNRTNPEYFSANFTTINLQKLAQQVISRLYVDIDSKQQQIELDADKAYVLGDEFSLGILLQNIIGNASKYCENHSKIKVTISSQTIQQNTIVTLSVEDSGAGIAEHDMDKVLQRFYRAEINNNNKQKHIIGSGLGLAIVKQISELHKAKLTLSKSTDLGGLKVTVCFSVPAAEQQLHHQNNKPLLENGEPV